jgi:signal transduction histidine kinase
MTRRHWPAMLAVLAVLVLGSYLATTHVLVSEIRRQNTFISVLFSKVQHGLLSGAELEQRLALFDMLQMMNDSLNLPMVALDGAGEPFAVANPPFETDLQSADGMTQAREFADRLARRHPRNRIVVPMVDSTGRVIGTGSVHFGELPLVGWLRWVPWFLVAGSIILLLVALAIIRVEIRADRERLWAAMARELAHQMGTPLSSMSGWIEVLTLPAQERGDWGDSSHIAHAMSVDLERLERVSRRFELIGKPPAVDIVHVRDVIEEVRSYFEPRLPRLGRGIRIRTRVDAGLPPIEANHVLLVWALENVVKNAVDALGGRGGRILVVAHQNDGNGTIHIHVADDGPGIDPRVRDRIFEPGITTKTGGWGVGLSLTRRIVEHLHGGRVTVRARRTRGTVFDVTLPVAGTRLRRTGVRWSRLLPTSN